MADKFKGNMPAYPQFRVDKFNTRMEGGISLRERIAMEIFVTRIDSNPGQLRVMATEACIAADVLIEVMEETKPTLPVAPPPPPIPEPPPIEGT